MVAYIGISIVFQPKIKNVENRVGAFVGLSFGTTKREDLLKPNVAIATVLKELSEKIKAKGFQEQMRAILQEEVEEAFSLSFATLAEVTDNVYPMHSIKTRTMDNKYVGGLDVLISAKKIIDAHRITDSIIICVHPTMWIRMSIMVKILKFKSCIVTTDELYDDKSDQWWTKNPLGMWLSEPIKCAVNIMQAWAHIS